jgi:hypothetical protein
MKKFTEFITEARKNPEQNPKISAYEALLPYSNNPDVYISFTELDKIGINPKSKYNTPLGIYTYPIKEIWKRYNIDKVKNFTNLPYAAHEKHIWVIKVKDKSTFIDDMYKDYGSDKFDKDEKILKGIYIKYLEVLWDDNEPKVNEREWKEFVENSLENSKEKNPVMSFWNLTHNMAQTLTDEKTGIKMATKWNTLLRQCGYSGFGDKSGKGYIHPAEPVQAVFLSKDAFIVLKEVYNKDYSQTGRPIIKINDMWDVVEMMKKVSPDEQKKLFMWLLEEKDFPEELKKFYKVHEHINVIWKYLDNDTVKYLFEYTNKDKTGRLQELLELQMKYYNQQKYLP